MCMYNVLASPWEDLCVWAWDSYIPLKYLLASFPGPPPFLPSICIQNNTWELKSSEKRGRHGSIHHVNDVRWTQNGPRGEGSNCQNNALDHPFERCTTVLDSRPRREKVLILTGMKLAFKFSMLLIWIMAPHPTPLFSTFTLRPLAQWILQGFPRFSLVFHSHVLLWQGKN